MIRGFRVLLMRFLMIWEDVSQKQISIRTGLSKKRVSRLLNLEEIEDEDYEKMLAAVRSEPARIEVVTGCIDGLDAVRANAPGSPRR